MKRRKHDIYATYIKRIIDISCSILTLILFWWVYLIIAVLVKFKLGSPVLFKQNRPGKDEKIFKLYKFRSMTDERDENGDFLPDEMRLTKFGQILRSTSLDELPELFNILKGDMSIVGPRPLAVQYLPYYNSEERRRHSVLPGLTGLAQINGRNTANWPERFKYDIEYVENVSFMMDVSIMLKTVSKVLKRGDVTVRGSGKVIDFDKYRMQEQGQDINNGK